MYVRYTSLFGKKSCDHFMLFSIIFISFAMVAPKVAFGILTFGDTIEIELPDPSDPTKCKKVTFGELVARMGADGFQMTTVIGFRRTYSGPCCDALHYLNIVTSDPFPPKWKDKNGNIHEVGNNPYIDPLSGGNIPPGQTEPSPAADRLPWYDNERASRKASETGDFTTGEKKEYDLNDYKQGSIDWTSDPTLNLIFGDAPTLMDGLQFVTVLMCVKDKQMCPVASVPWGYKDSKITLGPISQGSAYPSGLSTGTAAVQAALTRSGFGDYTVHDKCCPCIPEPATLLLLGLGGLAVLRKRKS